MKGTEILNVYFYALYDADDQQAHSGLIANICEAAVRDDIYGNYISPRYITIRRIPELAGISDGGSHVSIVQRPGRMKQAEISCGTCRLYGDCLRDRTDGLECCPDWEAKE